MLATMFFSEKTASESPMIIICFDAKQKELSLSKSLCV